MEKAMQIEVEQSKFFKKIREETSNLKSRYTSIS